MRLDFIRRWTDILHLALGFVCGFLKNIYKSYLVLSFLIALFIVFIAYQSREKEPPWESARDMVAFLSGFLLGDLFSSIFI